MDEQEALTKEEITEQTSRQSSSRRRRGKERRYRFGRHKRQRLPQLRWWREVLLVVFLLTAVLFLINPFSRLAQARATASRPQPPLAVTPPAEPESGYCIVGNFQDWDGQSTPLVDDGTEGDRTSGDGIYSRTVLFAEPDRYLWRVLPCGQWDKIVPEKSAWVFVTSPNQPITFTFNPAMPPSNLWPRSYALTANDTLPARVVAIGSFQANRWDSEDARTALEPVGNNRYQLAYRIPLPNTYETYVAIQGRSEGIGASGRSIEPVPLEFTTRFPSEMVVIQYDAGTDRIAVLSGMPWWLSWLGYGWGARIIAGISILGILVMGAQIGYRRVVLRPDWQYSVGCPNCEAHDLQRISRETSDYVLDLLGVPVRRYKCRQCGWEGRRIYRRHH
jgi:hypothetical protein